LAKDVFETDGELRKVAPSRELEDVVWFNFSAISKFRAFRRGRGTVSFAWVSESGGGAGITTWPEESRIGETLRTGGR
jgi:hypothetical protein